MRFPCDSTAFLFIFIWVNFSRRFYNDVLPRSRSKTSGGQAEGCDGVSGPASEEELNKVDRDWSSVEPSTDINTQQSGRGRGRIRINVSGLVFEVSETVLDAHPTTVLGKDWSLKSWRRCFTGLRGVGGGA